MPGEQQTKITTKREKVLVLRTVCSVCQGGGELPTPVTQGGGAAVITGPCWQCGGKKWLEVWK